MTAIKMYRQCSVTPWGAKIALHRRVDNNVDMSERFIVYTWCKVLISLGKGCFAGRTGERDNNFVVG